MHLVIDGYGGDYESLGNAEIIHDFLRDYPDKIGMTKVAPPQVYT
ncbi:MAG: S-adenosylmethionine decarboxylase proenzyme, partial [Chloroflexi bacterium]|nr:S-adenosylmethionine decarboxylase proenzyme [Chloroflexota bacterium]